MSESRLEARLAELAAFFAHLKRTDAAPVTVVAASWLYHLVAYRRFFPPGYLATAQAGQGLFAYMPLWGQFIDHRGDMKVDLVYKLLTCLKEQHSLDSLEQCFPYSVLRLESPIQGFYAFYKL